MKHKRSRCLQPRDPNPAIEFLQSALHADRQMDALLCRAQRYMDLATRATRSTTTLPGRGLAGSRVEDGITGLVDIAREIEREATRLAETVRAVERTISALPNPQHREILQLRYLNGWPWDRISEHLGDLDRTWVWRLHGRAVEGVMEGGRWGSAPDPA